jgi:hypothetical protein
LIGKDQILHLTTLAQKTVVERQVLIGNLLTIILYISIGLLLLGLGSIIFGLSKWFKKQADIDKRDLLTTRKLEAEVKAMTPAEVENKNKQEYEEATTVTSTIEQDIVATTTTTTIPSTRDSFILSYVQIEKFFYNKINAIYKDKYKILSNVKIGDSGKTGEYDLVLSSANPLEFDFIFEFKYYPNGVTKSTIAENLYQLDQIAIIYSAKVKRLVKPILLVVLPPDRINIERFKELKKMPKELQLNNSFIKLNFINNENLEALDEGYFDTLIK